jgi:hypothetical protein
MRAHLEGYTDEYPTSAQPADKSTEADKTDTPANATTAEKQTADSGAAGALTNTRDTLTYTFHPPPSLVKKPTDSDKKDSREADSNAAAARPAADDDARWDRHDPQNRWMKDIRRGY